MFHAKESTRMVAADVNLADHPEEHRVHHLRMATELVGVSLTRWLNARKLVDQHGGVLKLGEKLGMSKQQASHIFGARPIKGIGHSIARRVENEFGLGKGWMDQEHRVLIAEEELDEVKYASAQDALARAIRITGVTPQPTMSFALKQCMREHGLTVSGAILILESLAK